MPTLRIGTRGSALALCQSNWVADRLRELDPTLEVELVTIATRGDQILDRALSKVGGKGLFVTEIENALLEGRIDLAVHSLKDVPTAQPAGLALAAFPERVDPRDALLSRHAATFEQLSEGATVGTSSLRRVAQLRHSRPDLRFVPLRGNVDTRMEKLEGGHLQAIVLAAAGLIRLGRQDRIAEYLSPDLCLPAAGQGILCIETRTDDPDTLNQLTPLDSPVSRTCAVAERHVVAALGATCQTPVGALGEIDAGRLAVTGVVADIEGDRVVRASACGDSENAVGVAEEVVRRLRSLGADELLDQTIAGRPDR